MKTKQEYRKELNEHVHKMVEMKRNYRNFIHDTLYDILNEKPELGKFNHPQFKSHGNEMFTGVYIHMDSVFYRLDNGHISALLHLPDMDLETLFVKVISSIENNPSVLV